MPYLAPFLAPRKVRTMKMSMSKNSSPSLENMSEGNASRCAKIATGTTIIMK